MKDDLTLISDHWNYNCEITFDNGISKKVFADWLHNNNLDHWKGWNCDAGITRIHIHDNFDVYSARCNNDYLGNLNTEWHLLENSICKKDRCSGCTDDLILKKNKNND